MTIFEKNRKTHTPKLTWVDQWSHICNNNSGELDRKKFLGGRMTHSTLIQYIFRRQSVGECTSVGKHENARGQIRSPSHIWPIKYKLIGVLILLFHRIVGSSWSSSILYHGQCQSTRALSPFNWRTNYRPVYCVFRFVSWYLTELCGAKTQETKRENSSVS